MIDVALPPAEQGEELDLRQPGLFQHLMKQGRGDVPGHLVAQTDEQDLSHGERPLPGVVLLGADEAETSTPNGHPELPVGGRRHSLVEEGERSGPQRHVEYRDRLVTSLGLAGA